MLDLVRFQPSDFSFHGFESRMRAVERVFHYIGIRRGEPRVEIVENGIFMPAVAQPPDATGHVRHFHGGILDTTGQPVPAAHLRRRGTTVVAQLPEQMAVTPELEIDEEIVYLGWLYPHNYGVFLLESLARTWFLSQVDQSVRVAFHQPGQFPAGAPLRILERMGVPAERICIPKVPTRIRRILVPESLYELYYAAHERAAKPFQLAAARILDEHRTDLPQPPVYLSRRYMSSDKRTIVGEAALEEALRQNGFMVAYPEKMTLDEQVRLFNEHTDVVACVGSAAHNVLFARNRPRVHLLTAGIPEVDFFLVSAVAGTQTTFVNCLGEWGGPGHSLLVDMPSLVAYLTQQGFVTNQQGADLVALQPELRERYDEVLLSSHVRQAIREAAPLPPEIDELAWLKSTTSWPVSWLLAWHYADREPQRSTAAARQFIDLFAQDAHEERINHHQPEIVRGAMFVVGAAAETASGVASRLLEVLERRNMLTPTVRHRFQALTTEVTLGRIPVGYDQESDASISKKRRGDSVLIVNAPREQLLTVLPKGGTVAEIGVFRGLFSRRILDVVGPEVLHLIDPWTTESGSTPAEGKVMPEAYDLVLTNLGDEIASERVVLHRDMSTNVSETFPDGYFDWVYVDAMHDYANVLADLLAFKDKVKEDGFILGHDFANHARSRRYEVGVIPAVREFAANEGFDLVLITNEDHPSFLMTRYGNETTLPPLIDGLLRMRVSRPIEIDESLLDQFDQGEVEYANGRKGQMFRFLA